MFCPKLKVDGLIYELLVTEIDCYRRWILEKDIKNILKLKLIN